MSILVGFILLSIGVMLGYVLCALLNFNNYYKNYEEDEEDTKIKELEFVRDESFAKIAELHKVIDNLLRELDRKES
jgi:hypothetical protein